jgi:hypothetical protein
MGQMGVDGVPDEARRAPRLVLQRFCNGFAMMSGQRGGQTGIDGGPDKPDGVPDGPDGVLDGSHVIGYVIFECHIIRLG